ncbi:MAG: TIR domain-containing protein [Thermoleophilia bacterium]|nr:TIR domain-containing protein [Thermoleophilia bacterium]
MAHQVFVSYATEDADTASRVCALLEAEGIQCWVAPRDVKAGTDYAAAILNAIRGSQLVVLVFSTHSNTSPYALREIERSVAYGRPVLALRIDDAHPTPSLEYYLHDWIEAPQGVEGKQKEIISAARERLSRSSATAAVGAAASAARARHRKTWGIAAAVLAVAALGLGLGLGLTRDRAAPQDGSMGGRIAWSELKPAGTLPSERSAHAMAHDPTGGRMVMFGGMTITDFLNDTWTYDPVANTWTELEPSGSLPAARCLHAVVYDPSTRRFIIFGGAGDTAPLNDTWAYDPLAGTWTGLSPAGTLPPARSRHAMAYDPVTRRLIVFGGFSAANAPLGDTWAYDPVAGTWTELTPAGTLPPARSQHSLAYDQTTRRLIMFGGVDDTGTPLGDTWAYDPGANSWTGLVPAGTLPAARSAHSVAYDLTGGRLIVFGGKDLSGMALDDAWAYDPAANAWARLAPSGAQPSPREKHAMVYDPASGRLVMFGGWSIGGPRNDTWSCATGR